tara:strand:+ start:123 stop:650 length:528 start_codon:yes stop_codon:yes gene_type:complete
MNQQEKTFAVQVPRIAVGVFFIGFLSFSGVIPENEILNTIVWRFISIGILTGIYFSKRLYDRSNGSKVFNLIYLICMFDILFNVAVGSTMDLEINYTSGIWQVILIYMLLTNVGDLFPIWGKAAFILMVINFLLEEASVTFGVALPEATQFGWIIGVPLTLLAFSYVYSKEEVLS